MDKAGQDKAASTGAQRVRDHRARRRAAGLVEVKAWVRVQDVGRAQLALRPLTDGVRRPIATETYGKKREHGQDPGDFERKRLIPV